MNGPPTDPELGRRRRDTTQRSPLEDAPRDEPRAVTTSTPATAVGTVLATVLGAVVLGVGANVLVPVVVAIVAGVFLTATVTAATKTTPGWRGGGSLVAILAAGTTVAALGLAGTAGSDPTTLLAQLGVVLTVSLAVFGATAAATGAVGDGAVRSTIPVVVATSIPVALGSVFFTETIRTVGEPLGQALQAATPTVVDSTVAPESTLDAAVTFVILLAVTFWTIAFVVPRLPIVDFLPRDRRESATETVDRVRSVSWLAGFGTVFFAFVGAGTVGLANAGMESLDPVASPIETTVVPLMMVTGLRVAFLGVLGGLVGAYLVTRLPWLTRLRHSALARWLPVLTGGVVAAVLVVVAYPLAFDAWLEPALSSLTDDDVFVSNPVTGDAVMLSTIVERLTPPGGIAIVGFAIVGVLWTLVLVLASISALGALKLLPDRGAPGALGAGALVLGAVAAGAADAGTLTVAIPVACAIVAWDAASYGVVITDELSRDVPARRPAVAHITASAVVGAVGVLLAISLVSLADRVTAHTGVTVLGTLTIALLAVWIALKRRAKRMNPDREPLEPGRGSLGEQPLEQTGPTRRRTDRSRDDPQ